MPFRRLDIPPHVAEVIRRLPPDVKGSVKEALRTLAADATCGDPLRGELEGFWYRVRRFRIVYDTASSERMVRVVAVGHRRTIYETLADRFRGNREESAMDEPAEPQRTSNDPRSRGTRDRRKKS
jgi:mRNA interferase RelE/StbE